LCLWLIKWECFMRWIFFWRLIIGNSCECNDDFYNLLFSCWWNNQTQSFSLLLCNDSLILKIFPVTCIKDPKVAILILKMHTGSCLRFCKSYQKLQVTSFFCSQWEVSISEHPPITEKGILRRVSVSILKISSNFKEGK
jgi:hypothetical protein